MVVRSKSQRSRANGRAKALPYYGSKVLLGNAIRRWRNVLRRHLHQGSFAFDAGGEGAPVSRARDGIAVAVLDLQRERQLFIAPFSIVVGADDALHQVMPHYIAFVEIAETNTLDVLQDIDRLN